MGVEDDDDHHHYSSWYELNQRREEVVSERSERAVSSNVRESDEGECHAVDDESEDPEQRPQKRKSSLCCQSEGGLR